jgi:hypothetical protein
MRSLGENLVHGAQDVVVVGGLDQHARHAVRLGKLLRILTGEVGGIEDDREPGGARIGAQLPGEHVAVHAGHEHVGDDEVGRPLSRAVERLARVGRAAHVVARDFKQRGERLAVRAVVVDDEDLSHFRFGQSSRTTAAAVRASLDFTVEGR